MLPLSACSDSRYHVNRGYKRYIKTNVVSIMNNILTTTELKNEQPINHIFKQMMNSVNPRLYSVIAFCLSIVTGPILFASWRYNKSYGLNLYPDVLIIVSLVGLLGLCCLVYYSTTVRNVVLGVIFFTVYVVLIMKYPRSERTTQLNNDQDNNMTASLSGQE